MKAFRYKEKLPVKELYLKNKCVFPTLYLKDRSIPLTILKSLELKQRDQIVSPEMPVHPLLHIQVVLEKGQLFL